MFEGFERRVGRVGEGISIACVTAGRGRPFFCCTAFRKRARCGRGWRRACRSEYYRRLRRPARLWRVRQAEMRCRIGRTIVPRHGGGSGRASCARSALSGFMSSATTAAARTAHGWRSTIRRPCMSLAVLDIVPTYAMFMETNRHRRRRLLALVFPVAARAVSRADDRHRSGLLLRDLPRRLGRGEDRRFRPGACSKPIGAAWRDPAMIHGSCSDYRAAATIDLEHDAGRPRPQGRGATARFLWRERA